MGAIAVAIIGILGNKWAKTREERQKLRDFTRASDTELEKAHESRPWAEMGRRIADLKEEIDRLEHQVAARDESIDRLRVERDKLRTECVDWQIEARQAAALRLQCEQERLAHEATVTRLRQEIEGMRG